MGLDKSLRYGAKMLHYSKFPLFALLALLCAAVSGCSSRSLSSLSSDPQTTENILRESAENGAHVKLMDGQSFDCYAVIVRKDSTRWLSSDFRSEIAVTSGSVASIEIPNPDVARGIGGGVLFGGIAGLLVGGISNTSISLGFLIGAGAGGILGGVLGLNTETLYKTSGRIVAPDTVSRMAIPLVAKAIIEPDTASKIAVPSVDSASVTPDTRVRKWVPSSGFSTGFSHAGHWEYIPNDSLQSHDTTQTKLPH
jgi:hypothetical protein